ncbi:MAG: GTP-binding protein, partial [Pseudanabaenaceae cyanobacterium]
RMGSFSRWQFALGLMVVALVGILVWPGMGLLVMGALLAGLALFWRPAPRRAIAPTDKTAAAVVNLEAVTAQIEQVQDEIARETLAARAAALQQALQQDSLTVVVFGTGSAGKTSLVNAFLGREEGAIGAAMGTTLLGEVYGPTVLPGCPLPVQWVDCPGVFEAGGEAREQMARELAAIADLLIFVIDGDLTQSEAQALRDFCAIGKRLVVAFNKTDLYLPTDVSAIVANLRHRLQGELPPEDIVAIAARPAAVKLPDGAVCKPRPKIGDLAERLATLIAEEGSNLVVDNVLLRSHRLATDTQSILANQQERQVAAIIERYQWLAAGTVFAAPLPLMDLLAAGVLNAQMAREIGQAMGREISLGQAKEMVGALSQTLVGIGAAKGITRLATAALSATLPGILLRGAVQGVVAAYLTRIAGGTFREYFRQGETWGDGGMTAAVAQQFALHRRDAFLRQFVREAVQRAIAWGESRENGTVKRADVTSSHDAKDFDR